jgi:hypothetical protein
VPSQRCLYQAGSHPRCVLYISASRVAFSLLVQQKGIDVVAHDRCRAFLNYAAAPSLGDN